MSATRVDQIERCAAKLANPAERGAFVAAMRRAAELILEAAAIRSAAWARWRELTGQVKRDDKRP